MHSTSPPREFYIWSSIVDSPIVRNAHTTYYILHTTYYLLHTTYYILLISVGPGCRCLWFVLASLVLPLVCFDHAGLAIWCCACWCCRWSLLLTGFVGPSCIAAVFVGPLGLSLVFVCPLVLPQFLCGPLVLQFCFLSHWFCHMFFCWPALWFCRCLWGISNNELFYPNLSQ